VFKMNKLIFSLIFAILLIGIVSADSITFDNIKSFQKTANSYGIATIKNVYGLGSDLMKIELTKNTDLCMRNCSAEGTAELYQEAVLFNNAYFKDLKTGKDKSVSYKIYIQDGTIKGEVPIYSCSEKEIYNFTTKTSNIIKECKYDYIIGDIPNWISYKGNKLEAGKYKWKIEGQKEIRDNIDWIGEFDGVKITEWAVWNSSFEVGLMDYWSLDENTTSVIDESIGGINNGINYAGSTLGKHNNGILFTKSNTTEYVNISHEENFDTIFSGAVPFTINFWVMPNGTGAIIAKGFNDDGKFFVIDNVDYSVSNGIIVYWKTGGVDKYAKTGNGVLPLYNWTMVTVRYYGSSFISAGNISISINGTNQSLTIAGVDGGTFESDFPLMFGYGFLATLDRIFNGSLDEVGLWNRTLKDNEVTDLYNGGSGIFLNRSNDHSPIVTLNSPENYYNSSSGSVIFNCSTTDDLKIQNISFWLNGQRNYTATNGATNFSEIYLTRSIGDGVYNWTCSADDNATITQTGLATNRTFTIDTTPPIINITSIQNTTYTTNYTTSNLFNISLNFSFSDLNLESCWYATNNSVNTSITCGNNASIIIPYGAYNFFAYANDTFGYESSYNISANWNYKILQTAVQYNGNTTEGASETFILNFTQRADLQTSYVNLIYNGTPYTSTISASTGNITSTRIVSIPTQDTTITLPFYWSISLTNGNIINTTSYNQTVSSFQIDDCSVYTTLLYNYTLYDEETQEKMNQTTIELQLNMYDLSRANLILNYSKLYDDVNPAKVCINGTLPNGVNYSLDSVIRYTANYTGNNYAIKYYNILGQLINNVTIPQHIKLYDLISSKSTDFQLTYKDVDLAFAPNILVYVYRQYISDNNYKIVEIPLTDSNGQTVLHLVRNDVVYNLVMVNSSGDIVATFNKIIAFCQDYTIGSCSINLNAISSTDTVYVYTDDLGISYTNPVYSNTTGLVSFSFISNNLSTMTVSTEIIRNNAFGNRSVCTNSITSSTGTLTCDVSSITSTDRFLFTNIYVNGELKATSSLDLDADTSAFGIVNGAFLAFLLILLLICFFMEDKQVLIVMLVLGWIAVIGLGLMNGKIIGSLSAGIWLVVCGIMYLWKLKKEEVGI